MRMRLLYETGSRRQVCLGDPEETLRLVSEVKKGARSVVQSRGPNNADIDSMHSHYSSFSRIVITVHLYYG